jgi:hypothetical protein
MTSPFFLIEELMNAFLIIMPFLTALSLMFMAVFMLKFLRDDDDNNGGGGDGKDLPRPDTRSTIWFDYKNYSSKEFAYKILVKYK